VLLNYEDGLLQSCTQGDIKMPHKIKVTQVRSGIGRLKNQKRTLEALGLKKMHRTVIHNDTPQIRGMINCVKHLVDWEIIEG